MLSLTDIVITSDRLKLIPISEKYLQDIFREFTPDVTRYMFPKSPDKIDETLQFISSAQEKLVKGEDLNVVILNLKTGEFLGGGGINKINTDTPELDIWIKKPAHGNKYGQEAVKALKKWADKHLMYKYLRYPVDKRNVPSKKIAESLGGVVKAEYKKTNLAGNILDEVEYRIYPIY